MLASKRSLIVVTPEYHPESWGGVGTYATGFARNAVERGFRVIVIVTDSYRLWREHGPGPARSGIEVFQIPESGKESLHGEGPRRVQGVAVEDIERFVELTDVIYLQDAYASPLAAELLRKSPGRSLITMAHLPSSTGFSYFERDEHEVELLLLEALAYRLSTCVLVPSHHAAESVVQIHRVPAQYVKVVPLATCVSEHIINRKMPPSQMSVLSVGRLVMQKGLDFLIDVMHATGSHFRFTHIGDGPLRERFRRRTAGLPNFEWKSHLPHSAVVNAYRDNHIVLSTSIHETFGLSVLEGMAEGCVPVGFETPAFQELRGVGETPVLVPLGDTDALVEELLGLASDPERLSLLAIKARRRARDFSWNRHFLAFAEALDEFGV